MNLAMSSFPFVRIVLLRGLLAVVPAAAVACQAHVGVHGTAYAEAGGVRVFVDGDEIRYDEGEVRFATDSAELVGERTFATLDAVAALMKEHPDLVVRVEGYTDSRGSAEHNRALSEARAAAVVDYLAQKGIARDRLLHEGLGEARPKVPEPEACKDKSEDTAPAWCEPDVWSRNRRTEFHIVAGLDALPGR